MSAVRNVYKVARSVLFSAIILVAAIYLILYILLSIPPAQNEIKDIAQTELTKFFGGEVSIDNLRIMPFNEIVVEGLELKTPANKTCLKVKRVGAGINLMRLISKGEIEITYGEIIGLDGRVSQSREGEPLNIQFIIDAFAPKDKNKQKQKFDLKLRNVVLRRCRLQYDKMWMVREENAEKTDFNHLVVSDLKADITFPQIKNDDFKVDLRRMAFKVSGGLDLEKLAFRAHITPKSLSVENLVVQLPGTELRPSDITLTYNGYDDIVRSVMEEDHSFVLVDNQVTPSDFKALCPALADFSLPLSLSVEASGDAYDMSLARLLVFDGNEFSVDVSGKASDLKTIDKSKFILDNLRISVARAFGAKLVSAFPVLSTKVKGVVTNCGDVSVTATGRGDMETRNFEADCKVSTSCGGVVVSAAAKGLTKNFGRLTGDVVIDDINVGQLIGEGKIGTVNAETTIDATLRGKDVDGEASLYVSQVDLNGNSYDGIALEVSKSGKIVTAQLNVDNILADVSADVSAVIDGEQSLLNMRCDVKRLGLSQLGMLPKMKDPSLTGGVTADLMGSNPDNIVGEVRLTDFRFATDDRSLDLDRLVVESTNDEGLRHIKLRSDWIDGDVDGKFRVKEIPLVVRQILSKTLPSLFAAAEERVAADMEVEFSFMLHPVNAVPEFFNLPFRLLVPVQIDGAIRESDSTATLAIDIPYIQQGKNKLVRDSRLNVNLNGNRGLSGLELASTFPAKKGDLALDLKVWGEADDVYADVGCKNPDNDSFKGLLSLGAKISRDELTSKPEVNVDINPSIFDIGPARWNIDKGRISYDNNVLSVDNFKLWHDNQFVEIDGVASALPEDSISVRLADIDLDYVFDLLKINYVTFGGSATGEVSAKAVFSGAPVADTDNLTVESLSYNGTVLGDGYIRSHWDNDAKEVTIYADIEHEGRRRALIDGGIWITRDSLSFGIDADKVPIEFLKPFMSAFTSDVVGKASGKAKLFGTFRDIDLVGRLYADTIAMKLDFTNTWYHGSDSVYLNPGHIVIPSFRLYDKNGNSAVLNGDLTHEYFHNPRFTFRITDARGLLCYDTNAKMNPDWYGTIYGNGGATVRGWPGMVNISVDMDVVRNSTFTFVLNDTQAAEDYHFLTFSDKRKEEQERLRRDSVPDVLAAFQKKIDNQNSTPSKFSIDIRASVNPSALMTLVMDPIAGDKITARGSGAIQVEYESDSEEMQMFGKYTLDEGNYNFSLQDLILRDFSIRPGSSISFNGDPLNANLNITASYRVNTNLSDLDKSFSTDKDLARTNVPVDALLMVNGEMQHPDITFDIELPTLTQDVERKVKSIVSTDDMMSRQIIYLLALNRFYTPEYMGSTSNGGEWTAVASTTLSSQLQNMLGQLTDKFTLAPSFRSDKGDFSDLEVDVALSSRLLNNRLLVNGNFGYRDRSTSSTTFVGDFDLEYLLSRNGNLRLKAYNHFNDQNYYLREALTTQGIGVVYRRDFDNIFKFLRRKKKEKPESEESEENEDSDRNKDAKEALPSEN